VALFDSTHSISCQLSNVMISLTRTTELEILTVLVALNDSWKQFFSAVTSVTSALQILYEKCYINLRFTFTYLLNRPWQTTDGTLIA